MLADLNVLTPTCYYPRLVTKEANEAAVVVVMKRTESIEQRIRETCNYRKTDSMIQAELQGPPDWGGHLLRPKEPEITRDKAKEAAVAIFGDPQVVQEQEAAAGEADAMQLDPAPTGGLSGANPRNNTQEEGSRGRRMTRSNNAEPRVGEKDPKGPGWDEVDKILDDPEQTGVFRTFSKEDLRALIRELHQLESNTEPAKGWWDAFTARREAEAPEAKTLGATPGALVNKQSSVPSGTGPPSQRRKPGRPRKNPASEQGQSPQTPPQAKKNGMVSGRPQRSSSRIRSASGVQVASAVPPDHHGATEASPYTDSDALAARSPESEGDTWTSWLKNDWDVISTGASVFQDKAKPDITEAQNRLSNRNGTYTPADYDEIVDFIASQIRARKVTEGSEAAVLMQSFIWKAFAIVYQTDRSWKEWQDYYRHRAGVINQAARRRGRLRQEDALVDQMKQLYASGRYNSPPP
ncbi:hypothetical protein FRC01_001443, partial [Tulasnella sp. 417]